MFISEKKLLNGTLNRALQKNYSAAQIQHALSIALSTSMHLFLIIAIASGSLVALGLHAYMGLSIADAPPQWALYSLLASIVLALCSKVFFDKRLFFSTRISGLFLYLISLVSTLVMASGFAIIIRDYGLFNPPLNLIQVGIVFYYVLTCQVFMITTTSTPKVCALFAVGSLAPVIYELAFSQRNFEHYEFIYLYILAYALFVVVGVYTFKVARNSYIQSFVDRHHLLNKISKQKSSLEFTNQKLTEQVSKRVTAEEGLKKSKSLLEEQVAERTLILNQRNTELVKASQNLQLIQAAAKTVMWEWDPVNNVFSTSSKSGQITGYSDQEILELKGYDKIIHEEDREKYINAVTKYLHGGLGQEPLSISYRVKHKQGHYIYLEAMMLLIPREHPTIKIPTAIGIVRDVTSEKQTFDKLMLSDSVFEHSTEGIFALDDKLEFLTINTRFTELMACTAKNMIGRSFLSFLHTSDLHQADDVQRQLEETGEFDGTLTFESLNHSALVLNFSIAAFQSNADHRKRYAGTVSDMTTQLENQKQLTYLSNYDPLTDLPNRNLFQNQMHQQIVDPNISEFALVRINIDRFSVINSSLGQNLGDELLKMTASRISQSTDESSLLARFGSDDFCLLLSAKNTRSLHNQLDKLEESFISVFVLEEHEINVRISMGVSLYPQNGRQIDTLLNCSEQALKLAKQGGGNSYRVFSRDPKVSSLERLKLENELRKGIINDELLIHYQPKVSLKDHRLTGFEALVRWQHPTKGFMNPGEFLSVAQESDLIIDLGNEVMSQVCKQIHAWADILPADLRISINVEAQQFKRENFLELLNNYLSENQVDTRNIEIELTESSLLDVSGRVLSILNTIKSKNISIALDDFGTGYSSLSYLNQYPIDVLKIDRSFVDCIGTSKQSDALVKTIIAMGQSLELKVVAEGVETLDQVKFLADLQCQTAQGYYFGRPVDAEQATKLLLNAEQILPL